MCLHEVIQKAFWPRLIISSFCFMFQKRSVGFRQCDDVMMFESLHLTEIQCKTRIPRIGCCLAKQVKKGP